MGARTLQGPNMTTLLPRGLVGVAWMLSLAPCVAGSSKDTDVEHLVKELGSDKFKEREAATNALVKVGKPALTALQKAAADSDDAEVRARAARLILAIRDALVRPIELGPYVN